MFVSFFPSPRAFFWSAALWTLACVLMWFFFFKEAGHFIGLENPPDGTPPVIGVMKFLTKPFLYFYIYFAAAVAIFAALWWRIDPHSYFMWSVLGSALIMFVTYFQVEVSVAINDWYGPFYDMIQAALSKSRVVTGQEFIGQMLIFAWIALIAVTVAVLTNFFVSHYVFRWRTAMNNYYLAHWSELRSIEGASQRVQDDTMRFAQNLEDLGVSFINSVMTLIAFLPVLHSLESAVSELPIVGAIPYPLVTASIVWSIFGTGFLALIGMKLPGLEFRNQRVEAAYRKELVLGEDDPSRAQPPSIHQLFADVRHNYFRLYFNYLYFNIGRIIYLQTDNIFPYLILAPTIIAGKITLGPMNQIINAFEQVRSSFQYLVNSWTDIIRMISIYKRLRAFEATLRGEALPSLDQEYIAQGGEA